MILNQARTNVQSALNATVPNLHLSIAGLRIRDLSKVMMVTSTLCLSGSMMEEWVWEIRGSAQAPVYLVIYTIK